jgi:hypothetical protein
LEAESPTCEDILTPSIDASICDDVRSAVFIFRYAIRDIDAKVSTLHIDSKKRYCCHRLSRWVSQLLPQWLVQFTSVTGVDLLNMQYSFVLVLWEECLKFISNKHWWFLSWITVPSDPVAGKMHLDQRYLGRTASLITGRGTNVAVSPRFPV